MSIDPFADRLIDETGLTWSARDPKVGTIALRGSIHRMVIRILEEFAAVKIRYRKKPIGKTSVRMREAFKITPWGSVLLDALAAIINH